MFSRLSSLARAGALALVALIAVPVAASAQGEGRDHSSGPYQFWPRYNGNWNNGDNWRHGRHWNGNWDRGDRRWDRRHWDRDWGNGRYWRHRGFNSGIYLNFGIPAYRYYDGYYDEPIYKPRYYPRRAYRTSAHVEWCYDHYRSYRVSDNTWKPTRGIRRQCISPY